MVGLISFLAELMRLKSVPRIGWLLRGVRDVESVASHSFGVAVIAMLLADRARARGVEVNVERLLRMALLHDLTEARTGDLPSTIKGYFDKASIKSADESIAKEIFTELGDLSESYLELWSDYEHRASIESRVVKAADKLDLLMQSREYEKGGARTLQEFWDTADSDFAGLGVDDLISDLIEELKKSRKKDLEG
ncbi:MAG TPA: HD family hydrolase [Blastocatellia bacterium]|nr:HD family hydrolase [Blastocatellia bacterium]